MNNHPTLLNNSRTFGWAALVLMVWFVTPASGDIVWIRGQSTPLFGQIVSELPSQIELREYQDGRLGAIQKIERADIEQLVANVDIRRLERLSPEQPSDYRDYAEELAPQKSDLFAREIARRLFLIAAAESDDDESGKALQNSALTGLMSMAESESERRRIWMLRFLVGPDLNLAGAETESSETRPHSRAQAELMLTLVRAIRREESDQAIALLNSESNRSVFQIWSEYCSIEELDRIARVNRPTNLQLSKLLRIELQVLTETNSTPNYLASIFPARGKQNWGDYAMQGTGALSVVPSFENATSMDPGKSVFRDGQWVRPE